MDSFKPPVNSETKDVIVSNKQTIEFIMRLAAHSKRVRSYWGGYKPNGGNECLGKKPFSLWPENPTANLRLQGWAG